MGVTFVYAGIQKLTDPQYFNPTARGYIGHQIAAFATGSPLQLSRKCRRAARGCVWRTGSLWRTGDWPGSATGPDVPRGLALRSADQSGLLPLCGLACIPLFLWLRYSLSLLLADLAARWSREPNSTGAGYLAGQQFVEGAGPEKQPGRAAVCAWVLGIQVGHAPLPQTSQTQSAQQTRGAQKSQPTSQYRAWQIEQLRQESRRNFVLGSLSGGAVMLVVAIIAQALHILPGSSASTASDAGNTAVAPTLGSPVANETPTATLANGVIAQISSVPANSSATFTLPTNGDPGILVHLNNGQFVAFDATCTHAGCPVDYDPSTNNSSVPATARPSTPPKQRQ